MSTAVTGSTLHTDSLRFILPVCDDRKGKAPAIAAKSQVLKKSVNEEPERKTAIPPASEPKAQEKPETTVVDKGKGKAREVIVIDDEPRKQSVVPASKIPVPVQKKSSGGSVASASGSQTKQVEGSSKTGDAAQSSKGQSGPSGSKSAVVDQK